MAALSIALTSSLTMPNSLLALIRPRVVPIFSTVTVFKAFRTAIKPSVLTACCIEVPNCSLARLIIAWLGFWSAFIIALKPVAASFAFPNPLVAIANTANSSSTVIPKLAATPKNLLEATDSSPIVALAFF